MIVAKEVASGFALGPVLCKRVPVRS